MYWNNSFIARPLELFSVSGSEHLSHGQPRCRNILDRKRLQQKKSNSIYIYLFIYLDIQRTVHRDIFL